MTYVLMQIFCIMKYKKTIHNSTAIQNENVSPQRKNIFKRMWDLRLKKRTDERAFENLQRTESEFSHVSLCLFLFNFKCLFIANLFWISEIHSSFQKKSSIRTGIGQFSNSNNISEKIIKDYLKKGFV